MALSDVLGRPGEGVHFHVAGVAVVDLAATAAAAWWLARRRGWSPAVVFLVLVAVGEAAHVAAGVRTAGVRLLERLGVFKASSGPSS